MTSGGDGTSASLPGCATTSISPWGGNRRGEAKTYRNLALTMLLGGIVAWCGLELRVMGRLAWPTADRPPPDRAYSGQQASPGPR